MIFPDEQYRQRYILDAVYVSSYRFRHMQFSTFGDSRINDEKYAMTR